MMTPRPTVPELSVVICTYNPKLCYLQRTLRALEAQTFPVDQWELLLIDNASAEPVARQVDLLWHPAARHIRENALGLTSARLRGLNEATSDTLVFVDDDNVLAPDYLEQVQRIFDQHPSLGVIGGKITGEYEVPPPPWMKPFLAYLAIVDLGERELYALYPGMEPFVPYGAGMAIRRRVMTYYTRQVRNDQLRHRLDPIGDQLSRAGDVDMSLCAFDVNMAKGYYPQLRLTHLVPAGRLRMDYLLRLLEEGEYSRISLLMVRSLIRPPPRIIIWRQWIGRIKGWLRERFTEKHHAQLERAIRRGQDRAFIDFANFRNGASTRRSL